MSTELCGLSRQVVSYDREHKHDFLKTTKSGKWKKIYICVLKKTLPVSLEKFHYIKVQYSPQCKFMVLVLLWFAIWPVVTGSMWFISSSISESLRWNWHDRSISQISQRTKYPTIHHFNRNCTGVHISVTKWCIVGYGTGALWDLWNWSIRFSLANVSCHILPGECCSWCGQLNSIYSDKHEIQYINSLVTAVSPVH